MRFGIWTPTHSVDGPEKTIKHAIEILKKAERMGFDTTLVPERLMGTHLESIALAAAMATCTSSIELIGAIHPGIYNPQLSAKIAATLMNISNGRFAFNLVNGWWREEMDVFGNGAWLDRTEERYERMEEWVRVNTGLWTEDNFKFDGDYYKVSEDVPQLLAGDHPKFYTASRSETGRQIVASLCHHWFCDFEPGHRNFESNMARIQGDIADMNRRTESFGRKVSYAMSVQMLCEETDELAWARADAIEAEGIDMKKGGTLTWALGGGLVGSPELIAERINRLQDAGVGTILLRFAGDQAAGMELFTEKVRPLVQ